MSRGGNSLPTNGAPKVQDPIGEKDLQAVEGSVCQLLRPQQAVAAGVDPNGNAKPASTGPACTWISKETDAQVNIVIPNKIIFRGLSQYYKRRSSAEKDGLFLEMQPIVGFPTIAATGFDDRKSGLCAVEVGVTDTDVIQVGVTLSKEKLGKSDPCVAAHSVAELAIPNVRKVG